MRLLQDRCGADPELLYEDNETLAFLEVNPVHDGHSLVVSESHYPNVLASATIVVAIVVVVTPIVTVAIVMVAIPTMMLCS